MCSGKGFDSPHLHQKYIVGKRVSAHVPFVKFLEGRLRKLQYFFDGDVPASTGQDNGIGNRIGDDPKSSKTLKCKRRKLHGVTSSLKTYAPRGLLNLVNKDG